MLSWDPVNTYGQHWLKLHGVEVALVSEGPPIATFLAMPQEGGIVPPSGGESSYAYVA